MYLNRTIFWTLFLYAFSYSSLSAQTLSTQVVLGSTSSDRAQASAIDASGNLYLAGFFSGTMDVDPSASVTNLVSAGSTDAFLAKYSSTGTLIWAHAIGGSGFDEIKAIEVGITGDVFVVGRFDQFVDFDPSASGSTMLGSWGLGDGFIARYKSDGSFLMATQIGGTGLDEVYDIAVHGTDHLYVIGRFDGSALLDPGGINPPILSNGGYDIFVAQYTLTGSLLFAHPIGGASSEAGYGIAIDALSNVFITGTYTGTVDFDPSAATMNLTAVGFSDAFLAQYDKNGGFKWAFTLGGGGFLGNSGKKIAIDNTGVYLTGQMAGTGDFDPSAAVATVAGGASSTFVAKYDKNGGYQWAFATTGTFTSISRPEAISVDNSGFVYVAGAFSGTLDFDPSAATSSLTSAGATDGFIAKYDLNGNLNWAFPVGGLSDDVCYSVAAVGTRLLSGGSFQGTADFDPSAINTANASMGGTDVWLSQYSNPVFPVEWAYVEASPAEEGVWLDWGTATEENTDRFVIERSLDAQLFEMIGDVPAQGNSQRLTTYRYLDTDPPLGQVYYRLRQIDLNGRFSYSQLLTIQVGQPHLNLQLFPNPVHQKLTFQLSGELDSFPGLELSLLTSQGTCVHHVKASYASSGELDIRFLPPGLYFLQVGIGQKILTKRFVKK